MSSRTQEEQQRQRIATLEQRAREFQQKYEEMIESFATASLPLQRQAFECCVNCFDTCGIRRAGGGGEGPHQQQTQTTSAGSGWGRLFGRNSAGQAAADSKSPPSAPSPASAACATVETEERKGEKIHEKLSRCISGCHQKGEDVSRAVQQELDVLQSKLTSCQKVCYSRFADEKNAAAAEGGPLFTADAERCFTQCFSDAEPLMKEIASRVHKRIKENI